MCCNVHTEVQRCVCFWSDVYVRIWRAWKSILCWEVKFFSCRTFPKCSLKHSNMALLPPSLCVMWWSHVVLDCGWLWDLKGYCSENHIVLLYPPHQHNIRTYVCTYLCLDVHTYVYDHVNVPVEVNLVSTNSVFCDWNFFCCCIRMYIHSHVKVLFGCFCCLWLSNNAHTSKAKALSWPQTVCACGWESAAVKNKQSLLICWITVLICTYVRTYVPTYVHAYVRMCVCY